MTGRHRLPTRSLAERLQYQAELENVTASEICRMVDAMIEKGGATQTDIARSVGLDPARLSKALYPSNLTLRTLSLIALACDREWRLQALTLEEAAAADRSNYPVRPTLRPDDSLDEAIFGRKADGTGNGTGHFAVYEPKPGAPAAASDASNASVTHQ